MYFRSAPGSKLAAADNAVIAFEVDQIDPFSHSGWSVVIVGPSAVVDDHMVDGQPRVPRWLAIGPEHLVRITRAVVSGREIDQTVTWATNTADFEHPKGEPCSARSK